MNAFVLDASMTIAWHFSDEVTAITLAAEQKTLASTVVVPGHWHAEVANALFVGERSQRASPSDTARFATRLRQLDLVVDTLHPDDLIDRILPLARAHRVTIYDALYLELAERRGIPLSSLDAALCKAARNVGIPLLAEIP